jgi:hypothetical protein
VAPPVAPTGPDSAGVLHTPTRRSLTRNWRLQAAGSF